MKKVLILFLAAAVFSMAACQDETAPESSADQATQAATAAVTEIGEPEVTTSQTLEMPEVPDFELEANNGEKVTLSELRGKVVVLNFWATWCGYCTEEMPDFQKLHDELKDSEDVVLLMLNQTDGQRETREVADAFLIDNDYDFLNLYDPGDVGYGIFGLQGLPATVVIDAQGRLADYTLGMTNYDKVIHMIDSAQE